ncbi:MAG: phosphoribosylamine--glycine ligase [Planctomycetes bacterium]|nr:phosphoribosylamine--glycine ligase [Planctomycetota bacterium]
MRVLIVGSGGREHALAWKIDQSDRLTKLYCAPGNAGTAGIAENVNIDAEDLPGLLDFARQQSIDLTIVGPEDPLCAGIVDLFTGAGLRIFGPSSGAARIEGDKAYAKQFMKSAAIPTAEARIFDNYEQAREYVATRDCALVVKASGLAKGKGVLVCSEPAEALLALDKIMIEKQFGAAGDKVVVEERLSGPEISIHALVDGRNIYVLEPTQDHKPIGEGDTGPNTGGMGAYSPAAILDESTMRQVCSEILVPAIDAMTRRETPYKGVLYAGLMLTAAGPKVLEFNCRFGDPEAQVLLARLQTDLLDVIEAVIDGNLEHITLDWDRRAAVCVVLASEGYPGAYLRRKPISGLDPAGELEDVVVFHSGTAQAQGRIVTNGGRVLGVTALGEDVSAARDLAYRAAGMIDYNGVFYRKDIALQGIS